VITRKICHEVELETGEILLGSKVAQMSDAELADSPTARRSSPS
jgi:P-type Mg2+ transporter